MQEDKILRNPIVFNRPDYCPNCNTNSIEIYNGKNQPCRLTLHLNMGRIDKLISENQLMYMKCNHCKRQYKINWMDSETFIPMNDENFFINKFIANFKQNTNKNNY